MEWGTPLAGPLGRRRFFRRCSAHSCVTLEHLLLKRQNVEETSEENLRENLRNNLRTKILHKNRRKNLRTCAKCVQNPSPNDSYSLFFVPKFALKKSVKFPRNVWGLFVLCSWEGDHQKLTKKTNVKFPGKSDEHFHKSFLESRQS